MFTSMVRRMPELPDITVYLESITRHLCGDRVLGYAIRSPFVLRTVEPSPDALVGAMLDGARRIGKRVVLEFSGDLHLVIHLMIAGRLRWRASGAGTKVPASLVIAELVFGRGTLFLTEAGTKKRASLHLVRGRDALVQFQRGGLDVFEATTAEFIARVRLENHTLKRTLTDPRLFDGIGNAYSDEILHRARLSPLKLSLKLTDAEAERLHDAARVTLAEWTDRLRADAGAGFPEKVTAFHADMAVHGRHGKPCPACGTTVQRIRYRDNETNYCPRCQTEGRLLADRALSRLLKQDWPRTVEELER